MKDENEATAIIEDNENAFITSIFDFVNLLNPDELMIEKIEIGKNSEKPENSYQLAVLIDPIDPTVTYDMFKEACAEYFSKCHIFIVPSIKNNNENRVIIYTDQNSIANKVYKKTRDYFRKFESMLPLRVRVEEIIDPPKDYTPPTKEKVQKTSKKQVIVVDPIPDEIGEEGISKICAGNGKYTLSFDESTVENGKRRALIQPINSKASKNIFKLMNNDEYKLSATRVPQDKIYETSKCNENE